MSDFAGLITNVEHELYNCMIDALLEDKALTVCCEFIFGNCRFIECDNCQNGAYITGGPAPFPNGALCPFCFGKGKTSVEERECHWMCVEFESRSWNTSFGKNAHLTRTPQMGAESFCKIELWPKIMSAESVILDNCNPCVARKYKRVGHPELCGLGRKSYIRQFWEIA